MVQPVFESVEPVTVEQFFGWVVSRARLGDDYQYELLNGRILMTPPAGLAHGKLSRALNAALSDFVGANKLGQVTVASQGFEFPVGDVVMPDLAFVSNERWNRAPESATSQHLRVVPDLVVEILSSRTRSRDRGEKRGIYERAWVREYWIVDPLAQQATVLVLSDGHLTDAGIYAVNTSVCSSVLPGFEVPLAELFRD